MIINDVSGIEKGLNPEVDDLLDDLGEMSNKTRNWQVIIPFQKKNEAVKE
jgi:hypothetical protein